MKNLESFGVQELNAKEIREVEGGLWPLALLGWYVYETLNDVDSATSSFNSGWNAA